MASYPDIVVTAPESPSILVAVETRVTGDGLDVAADRLTHYLASMSCPVGLLVLPGELRIYRNLFLSGDERSVQQVGRFSLESVEPFESWKSHSRGRSNELEFERLVQRWLESLAEGKALKSLLPELVGALEEHVMPALERGAVRAAGPRETKLAG